MRKLMTIVIVLFCLACQKEQKDLSPQSNRTDFFKNQEDALGQIQAILDKKQEAEKAFSIESISYMDAKNKSFAFVFYHSDQGLQNLVIEKKFNGSSQVESTSYKCEGETCTCKVRTIISDNGDVSISCNCSSCTLLTNGVALPAPPSH